MNSLFRLRQSVVFPSIRLISSIRSYYVAISHSQIPASLSASSTLHQNAANRIIFQPFHNHQQIRNKMSKSGKRHGSADAVDDPQLDLENETESTHDDNMPGDSYDRTTKAVVNSLRADLLLKAGLGIARNKVDALFYDSKIRVNGKKLTKKSAQLSQGDEIDVVRKASPTNPNHLVVSRVEILSVTPQSENLLVIMRRHKSLIIENYD